jgi:glycerate kinase
MVVPPGTVIGFTFIRRGQLPRNRRIRLSMNILIAPDKFKGSLTAREVCTAIEAGLRETYPDAEIEHAPLADGGDGTLTVLREALHLRPRPLLSRDPLGRPLEVTYLERVDSAFIEVAAASGLVLLGQEERDPLLTTTFGTGLQLRDALAKGKTNIFLLLGGSATNDLGLGIAEALGFTFFDTGGAPLRPRGGRLSDIARIEYPEDRPWEHADITLLCDVDNRLCGPAGAARMFAPQKGADLAAVEQLENGARHVARLLEAMTGQRVLNLPGSGAAGGIGAGMVALLGARLTPGFAMIAEQIGLEEKIRWADVVISGEGQLDQQSLHGKVIGGILDRCERSGTPCQLFAGRSTLPETPKIGDRPVPVHEIIHLAPDVDRAMKHAADYLTELARRVIIR